MWLKDEGEKDGRDYQLKNHRRAVKIQAGF